MFTNEQVNQIAAIIVAAIVIVVPAIAGWIVARLHTTATRLNTLDTVVDGLANSEGQAKVEAKVMAMIGEGKLTAGPAIVKPLVIPSLVIPIGATRPAGTLTRANDIIHADDLTPAANKPQEGI